MALSNNLQVLFSLDTGLCFPPVITVRILSSQRPLERSHLRLKTRFSAVSQPVSEPAVLHVAGLQECPPWPALALELQSILQGSAVPYRFFTFSSSHALVESKSLLLVSLGA